MTKDAKNAATSKGLVYLVGSGPGDPGLLTRRAAELIGDCDVLIYDALVSPEVLALSDPGAERVYVGKRGGQHTLDQDGINALLTDKARSGNRVVRLKGGDPYLFGRGGEEALFLLARGIDVEVVPGVTAGIAAPAYAGIPVTHRRHTSAVAFVTGHEDPSKPESALDWASLAKIGTLCFYMGVKNLGRISRELSKHMPETTPVAVIQWGTTPRQRSVTGCLRDIESKARSANIAAPALTIVGHVVALRKELNLFERRPLFGRRIVVTRSRAQASDLAQKLVALGAEVLAFPTIRVAPPEDPKPLRDAVSGLSSYDWIILTSVNGVDALFDELNRTGRDARAFGGARVAAIGSATAARLAENGIRADLIPPKFVAESIVESLHDAGALGREGASPGNASRFLLPRADIARSALPEQLRALGGEVSDVVSYRTVLETEGQEDALQALREGGIDGITFTSSSTARNFVDVVGRDALAPILRSDRLCCFSIGPITTETMRGLGLPVTGEADVHDIPGLVALLIKSFS